MPIAILTIYLHLPDCQSLKQKRSHIQPVLNRLKKEFNVATAEIDHQDMWHEAVLACVTISNDQVFNQRIMQKVIAFTEATWPDMPIIHQDLELL